MCGARLTRRDTLEGKPVNLPNAKTIAIDVAIAVGVGVLLGVVPGIGAAAIALLWTFPNTIPRRGRIALTVALVAAIALLCLLGLLGSLSAAAS